MNIENYAPEESLLSEELKTIKHETLQNSNSEESASLDIKKEEIERQDSIELAEVRRSLEVSQNDSLSKENKSNSNENPSLLLFSRINNPVIKNQIIKLLSQREEYELTRDDAKILYDENGDLVFDNDGNVKMENIPTTYIAKTEDQLSYTLQNRINEVSSDTPISLGGERSSASSLDGARENISLYDEIESGAPLTNLQKSIIEAHEKGHVLRPYDGEFFKNYFSKGLDMSKIKYGEQEYDNDKKKSGDNNVTFEEAHKELIDYMSDGREVAERMSQLKNYFGMKEDEEFTKDHLLFAKNNYIKDTKLDNHMEYFFQAITKEKEDDFIKLINTSGI
ncbi:MAG: hypothetical protein WCN88_04640 [Candidatus Falkowbacteria bacterium]